MIRATIVGTAAIATSALLLASPAFAQSTAEDPYADVPSPTASASPPAPAVEAPPLTPRVETPSDVAERQKRPHFLKPSELHDDSAPAPPPAATGATAGSPGATPAAPSDFCGRATRPERRGYFLDASGTTFAPAPCRGIGPSVFYVRGFFSYSSNDFDEWSGAELGWQGMVARDFALGALLHHEYREQRTLSLGAWMSARLHDGLHGYIGVDAGNATYYAPVTALDLEIGNRFASMPRSYFAFGAGSARYSEDRQYWSWHLRHAFELGRGWRGEAKLGLGLFDAPSISARAEPLIALSGVYATATGPEWQARVAYTSAPAYRVGADPSTTRDHPDLSVALGAKYWLSATYGFIAELEYERLWGSFDRVGADYTVFFAGP